MESIRPWFPVIGFFVRRMPCTISSASTFPPPRRVAMSTASFTTLLRSAPLKPAVPSATRSAYCSSSLVCSFSPRASSCSGMSFRYTRAISLRPFLSGSEILTFLESLPGRIRASSRTSGRLVAHIRRTSGPRPSALLPSLKPSSSVSSWFRVWSRSSFKPAPLFPPTASISSINTMLGALILACLNRSLTLAAPRPTKSSTNSLALQAKKGTLASPATAFASSVFPVPGGPLSKTPLGILMKLRRALPLPASEIAAL
mmetsp:Transcript_8888/g.26884  ORF Transcript_8888/g.26884 Transcript_8888/m.26884 type:complete len:258 (-) Transcript_8888:54-827(-)